MPGSIEINYRLGQAPYSIATGSPVDVLITDSCGRRIGKGFSETPGAESIESDDDGDDDLSEKMP